MGGVILGLVVLHSVRKQAEQTMGSRPVRSISSSASASVPAVTPLHDDRKLEDEINLFSPQLASGPGVCHSSGNPG